MGRAVGAGAGADAAPAAGVSGTVSRCACLPAPPQGAGTKKAGLGPSSQICETPLQSEVLGRPLLLGGEGPSHGYQCRTSVKQFPLWN